MPIKNIELKGLYVTKKIEPSAFKTALASTHQTAYRLYLITNSIKEVQPFFEESHPDLFIHAYVKTEAALAGEARSQAWNVKHLSPLLRKRPKYIVKVLITDKMTNRRVYKLEFVSINEAAIYHQIQMCIEDIKDVIYAQTSHEAGNEAGASQN